MALTVKRVQKLTRAGVPARHTDTGGVKGLMLCIESKTSAYWLLRYQRNMIVRHMGLGSARDLLLPKARERALRERERLTAGEDPLTLRRALRKAERAAAAKVHTFKEAAERFFESKESGWSNAHHRHEFLSSLRRWVFPVLGSLDVAAIGKDEVLRCLEQRIAGGGTFWHDRAITADRTRNRIERVLDYAEAREWRTGTNPARWAGFLENLLATPRAIAPVVHMRALPFTEVPALMSKLASMPSTAARALQFIVFTASRLSEALGATWDEFDLAAAEWRISAGRMKSRKEHRVPLAPQVMALLTSLPRETGNKFLFVSPRDAGMAVNEMTVRATLRRAGCTTTIHGFRSAFKTWAGERTKYHNIEVEKSLAHAIGNAVEQSYTRGDLFEKRRKLMAEWATFCSTPVPTATAAKGKVIPLRKNNDARA